MRRLALALTLALPVAAAAQTKEAVIADVIDGHILPRYHALTEDTQALADTAAESCAPDGPALRAAYNAAFDAWMGVSHLRFGPSETENRAFGLAFWPDTRGATPKALLALIADADPVVDDAGSFATVSIAARGFYALELLLYDAAFTEAEKADYLCRLIRAIASDIARTAAAIESDWTGGEAEAMRNPGSGSRYRDTNEVLRVFYTALTTGLQMTSDTRLGRPLGSFERPRPNRAEARRSGRSLRHVVLSLDALSDLALRLAALEPAAVEQIDAAFAHATERAGTLDDPVFEGVAEPQSRIRVEDLRQRIDDIRALVGQNIAPALGIAAGFNSMDGD
jgi:uncharacterized protein